MEILIVRSLKESDLGLFAEHRASETSRQRAINLNADLISELLSEDGITAGELTVDVSFQLDDLKFSDKRPIKRTGKNWRLGGNKIVGKAFDKLDAADFMLLRSRVRNDGSHPMSITFIARRTQPVIHAGIANIVERKLKGSMTAFEQSDAQFRSLAPYCPPPEGPEKPQVLSSIPDPESPVERSAPATVEEKVRSPWIMERMFRMAGDLSAPAQVSFIETVEALASQLRKLLMATGRIIELETGHGQFWPKWAGQPVGFVDGGLANLSMLGSAPLAARVGGYVVVPGKHDEDREQFVMLKQLIDDLFEHGSGGVYETLFPDYGALRDAARISIEAAGAVRLADIRQDLSTVMVHGSLVNPVSRYSDLMSDGKVRHEFPGFSDTALRDFLPEAEGWRKGRDRNFISVYLRQLELMQESEPLVCGVVEREGTTSTVSAAVLDSFQEHDVRHLLPRPFEEWRSWYRRAVRPDDDDDMEGPRINDSLLFRCVLKEGEALLPVAIDRNELRRAPEAWKSVIAQYPKPHVSFIQISEWSAPVRLELFEGDLDRFEDTAELVFHSSRLLPKYAFPAGLDIVDKFAHVPNWMARQANTRATVQALNIALQNKDYRTFDNLRRMLCGTGREWMLRPGAFR